MTERSPSRSASPKDIRPRSAHLPPKPTLRRGLLSTGAGCSLKTSRAAGSAVQVAAGTVAAVQDSRQSIIMAFRKLQVDRGGNGTIRRYPERRQSRHRAVGWRWCADCLAVDQSDRSARNQECHKRGTDGLSAGRAALRSAVEGIGDIVAEAQQEISATTPARGRADGRSSHPT